MKKILVLLSFIAFLSCESDGNNQFCDIISNQTINLANPEFNNLLVPAGWSYANGGTKGLVIYNFNNSFRAFSRECPNLDCSNRMIVENDTRIICPCDDAEYSILDGSPINSEASKSVCEFRVVEVGSSALNITNF
jgi:nitrite reductase/ring-hydroxylating ferredoxin subunit